MNTLRPPRGTHRGLTRRDLLEVGFSSLLGCSLASLAGARAEAAGTATGADGTAPLPSSPRAKRVLFVFLFGGPSQLDTFDLKPDAPAEVRSIFQPIDTQVPGWHICEHLPGLAQRVGRLALVRTLCCNPNFGDHRLAVHGLLGGIDELPAGAGLAASRRDWPCWSAVLNHLRPAQPDLPSSVVLPGEIVDPGTGLYPGQNAGLLGAKFDPFRVDQDPAGKNYRVDGALALPPGLTIERLAAKRQLLDRFDAQRQELAAAAETGPYTTSQQQAFDVLTGGRLAEALDLDRETPQTRDQYGRHSFGQTLLLARRLLESGVSLVQANLPRHAFWDTHYNNFDGLRDLLPHFDRAVAALLDDLDQRGLVEDTLVVIMGEFGRTPKLVPPDGILPHFKSPGRDHWMNCYSGLFAGAGVRGGQVIGRSDALAAFPATEPYTHADVGATVYTALGIDPASELSDGQGRPLVLNRGRVMRVLYSGANG